MSTDDRLLRLLGGAELNSLRERLRQRFEGKDEVLTLQLSDIKPAEREALALLVGKPSKSAKSMTLDVRVVDENLAASGIAPSLRAALERLDGPIVDRAAERANQHDTWARVACSCEHPIVQAWAGNSWNLGLLKRLSRADPESASATLLRVSAVLQRLPCQGMPRSQLAAEVLGDAHGLDAGKPTATIVLSVLRANLRAADSGEEAEDGRVRSLWASAGVLVNELAKPALLLNVPFLPGEGGQPTPGRPSFFSLRDLARYPPAWQVAGRTVYVCENPNVVAIAADALGKGCAPLVCTDGMPAAAQRVLLSQLQAARADLAYHGDFDWPGLRIADQVIHTFAARPWRMAAEDYLAAVALVEKRAPLSVRPDTKFWDSRLAEAMGATGVAIAEEAVFKTLMKDLSR